MSGASVTSGLTWDEFLDLPDDPRYRHAELVDGDVILVNPPSWLHQRFVGSLHYEIERWIRAGPGRGVVLLDPPVQISSIRGYLPDLAWYREGRTRPRSGNPYLSGAPDLAIEVLSPSTRRFDLVRKRADYARVGVRELWLVDPDGPAALLLRSSADSTSAEFDVDVEVAADGELTSPLLPGLAIHLGDLVPAEG